MAGLRVHALCALALSTTLGAQTPEPAEGSAQAPQAETPDVDAVIEAMTKAHLAGGRVAAFDRFAASLRLKQRLAGQEPEVLLDVRFMQPSWIRYRVEEGGKNLERGRDKRGPWHKLAPDLPPKHLGDAESVNDRRAIARDVKLARQLLSFLDPAVLARELRDANVLERTLGISRSERVPCNVLRGEVDDFPLYATPQPDGEPHKAVFVELYVDRETNVLRAVRAMPIGANGRLLDVGEMILMPRHRKQDGVLLPIKLVFVRLFPERFEHQGQPATRMGRETVTVVEMTSLDLRPELGEASFDRAGRW